MVLRDSGLLGFWHRFGSVTGFFKPAPSPKPRQKPKILAAHYYIFSVNALKTRGVKHWGGMRTESERIDPYNSVDFVNSV